MRASTAIATVLLLLSAGIASPQEAMDPAAAKQKFKAAFKPVALPPAAQIEKTLTPLLPAGIVVEPRPFDELAQRLLDPWEPVFAQRCAVMRAIGKESTAASGALFKEAFKVAAFENRDWSQRAAQAEKAYAGAYDKEFTESTEEQKRVRKLAAVLIPFYQGLLARNEGVAAAAADGLAEMKDGAGSDWLAGPAAGDSDPGLRRAVIRALGRVGGDKALETLRKSAKGDGEPWLRAEALNSLMAWKLKDVKAAVIEALGDPAWEVRALAVAICGRGRLVEAAGALIERIGKEDGRLRQDIDDALYVLVEVKYYGDADLWRKWWKDNQAGAEEKSRKLAEAGEYDRALGADSVARFSTPPEKGEHKGATFSFYGISTLSKKIIFVIDISKSMENAAGEGMPETTGPGAGPWTKPSESTKICIAKWQLHRAVHALPRDAAFNIIVYSESFKVWQEGMTPATPRNVGLAHEFIESLRPNGTTNIFDSLVKAFEIAGAGPPGTVVTGKKQELAADTVFLLSDGQPNRGRVTDSDGICREVAARNRSAGLVIHTIGIGEAAGLPFMRKLAEDNGGRYAEFR